MWKVCVVVLCIAASAVALPTETGAPKVEEPIENPEVTDTKVLPALVLEKDQSVDPVPGVVAPSEKKIESDEKKETPIVSSSETDGKVVKVVLEKNQPVDPLPESTVADEKKIENDEIVKTAANELYLYGSLATERRRPNHHHHYYPSGYGGSWNNGYGGSNNYGSSNYGSNNYGSNNYGSNNYGSSNYGSNYGNNNGGYNSYGNRYSDYAHDGYVGYGGFVQDVYGYGY